MPMASSPSLSVSAPLSHPLPRALPRTFVFSPSRTIPNPTRPASFPFHSRTFPRVPSPSPHLPLKLLCSRESKGTLSLSLIQPFLLPLIYDYACDISYYSLFGFRENKKKKVRETCRSYCISLLLLNLWLKKVLVVIFSFFSSFLLYNRVSWSLVTESKS